MSDGAVNRLSNQLSGVNDLTPIEVRAKREMQLRAIDNILDTIGAEYIQCFLPMWETSGSVLKDLLKPDLTFTLDGPVLNNNGAFGGSPYFDGVNDYAVQSPIPGVYATAGASLQALAAPTAVAVQKLATFAEKVGYVRVWLQKTGAPDGSVKLELRTAKDGVAIANGTSNLITCASLAEGSTEIRGFYFAIPPGIPKNTTHYLALVYDGNTNADGANNVAWVYDSAGGYSKGRHYYNGAAWTDTPGEDHAFEVYDSRLVLPDDWTILIAANPQMTTINTYDMIAAFSSVLGYCRIQFNVNGYVQGVTNDGSARNVIARKWPLNNNHVFAMSFSKALDTKKVKLYQNGVEVGTVDGTAATAHTPIANPWSIGCILGYRGSKQYYFKGLLGPFLFCSRILTPAEIAKVSHNLLVMRKLREAV
jgi:hypothetical protein